MALLNAPPPHMERVRVNGRPASGLKGRLLSVLPDVFVLLDNFGFPYFVVKVTSVTDVGLFS